MRRLLRRDLVVSLPMALLLSGLAAACTVASRDTGDLGSDERRLLPQIIRQQEQRARNARQALDAAQNDLAALRLRQRMLVQHGRSDLAAGLEPLVTDKEGDARRLRQRLANEEDALAAYRDYGRQAGVAFTLQGVENRTSAPAYDDQPPGSP